ncbi:MAG: hypothetical protein O2955_08340 [Planctomycetota bacterium]|nr:hypothetical protein [Planctomycetota bacterium]MDA1212512.1 hypothetical protein [Planctomycetota bacterium]
MMTKCIPVIVLMSCVCLGCFPGATVTKNPTRWNKGIRYYRPKPYLFIQPIAAETKVTTETQEDATAVPPKKATKTTEARTGVSDRFVEIKLQWLPDFSEEYAIKVHSGFGTNTTNITLENGWNLTAINQTLDSQTDENITAVSKLIDSVASGVAGANKNLDGRAETAKAPDIVVRATDIPLGYYESVIAVDPCGKKQLYGWRYVGFMPYGGCPVRHQVWTVNVAVMIASTV